MVLNYLLYENQDKKRQWSLSISASCPLTKPSVCENLNNVLLFRISWSWQIKWNIAKNTTEGRPLLTSYGLTVVFEKNSAASQENFHVLIILNFDEITIKNKTKPNDVFIWYDNQWTTCKLLPVSCTAHVRAQQTLRFQAWVKHFVPENQ